MRVWRGGLIAAAAENADGRVSIGLFMKHRTETPDRLRVAKPCAVDWDEMSGGGRTRFCSSCDKHVHDLSLLTRAEVAGLVSRTGGRFCGKLSRLPDGTLITSDLFVARPRPSSRAGRAAGATLTALLSLCANAFAQTPAQPKEARPPYVLKREDKAGARVLGVASLHGTLYDIQDAVIAGAEITLREKDSGREYAAVTDAEGVYVFPSLEAGVYTFAAFSPGFITFRKSELSLRKGESLTLDATLQVGTLGEIVMPPHDAGAAERAATRIANVLTLPYRWVKEIVKD